MVFLQSLMLISAGLGAIHYAVEHGDIEMPSIPIETPDLGITETLDRVIVLMLVSTVSMVVLMVTFTYLYPKWK